MKNQNTFVFVTPKKRLPPKKGGKDVKISKKVYKRGEIKHSFGVFERRCEYI